MLLKSADGELSDIEAIGTLEMDLSDIDRQHFSRIRNQRTKKWYLRMEYEVRVYFDYPRLTYEVIIPRNGKFPDAESWGDDPIRKPAVLNCAAAIEVTRPQAIETPTRSRLANFTPAPADKAAGMAGFSRPNLRSAESYTSERRLDSPARQKSCHRCRKLKVRCIRRAFGKPCYKCIRAGDECISRS